MNILIKLINDVKATLALIKAKTDTITASVITQAQANNLDATISSRQANAGLTTTHASRIDASISSRASQASVDAVYSKVATGLGGIKSVQRGAVLLDAKSNVTIPISSVTVAKSFLVMDYNTAVASAPKIPYTVSLEATSISLAFKSFQGTDMIVSGLVNWQVVEYY